MKLYDYVIILALIAVSFAGNLWISEHYLKSEIKVVDVVKLLGSTELMEKVYKGEVSPEEAMSMQVGKAEQLKILLRNEKGIVLLKQCVLGGEYEDVTERVRKRLMY